MSSWKGRQNVYVSLLVPNTWQEELSGGGAKNTFSKLPAKAPLTTAQCKKNEKQHYIKTETVYRVESQVFITKLRDLRVSESLTFFNI